MIRVNINKRLVVISALTCGLSIPAGAQSPSVALVSPAQGGVVTSRNVEFRAAASGFTPASISFYLGDPADASVDVYLGGSDRVEGGQHLKTVEFAADGTYRVYVEANGEGRFVRSPLLTFTIDTKTAPPKLLLSYPPADGVVTASRGTFCIETSGFTPVQVNVYQGDPADAYVDVYLGEAERLPGGLYSLDYTLDFKSDSASSYPVYVIATDGMTALQTPVSTFTVDPRPGAVSSPRKGDLNADGRITVPDATLSLRIGVGLNEPTTTQRTTGDVNNDSRLNVQDTTIILRIAVGLRPACM